MRGPFLVRHISKLIPTVRIEVVTLAHDLCGILEFAVKCDVLIFRSTILMGQMQTSTNQYIPAEDKLASSRQFNLIRSNLPTFWVCNTSSCQRHGHSLVTKADTEYPDPWVLRGHLRYECKQGWSPSQGCISRSSFAAGENTFVLNWRISAPYHSQILR
jgi:hypothetical protein